MNEKTFAAIGKLKEIELELHRLKNALEMANKALDAKCEWVSLTEEEIDQIYCDCHSDDGYPLSLGKYERALEAKLREKNT